MATRCLESSASVLSSARAAALERLREEHGHGLQHADLHALTFEELLGYLRLLTQPGTLREGPGRTAVGQRERSAKFAVAVVLESTVTARLLLR